MQETKVKEIEHVRFLDTTLRDGNKLPFVVMNLNDRLEIAGKLAELGVDIIDAGYPRASMTDKEAVALISREVRGVRVSALSRAVREDIDFTVELLKEADKPYLHIFMPVSRQFISEVLKKANSQVVKMIHDAVLHGKERNVEVQFSFSEFTDADRKFLQEAVLAACESGADTVSFADTNGILFPKQVENFIANIREELVKNGRKSTIGVHFHNDFGVATANTLSAIRSGARHVEVTIGGIGARAGNTPLEEVLLAMEAWQDELRLTHGLIPTKIHSVSELVSHLTGVFPHPNKPVIGRCAFREPEGSRSRDSLKPQLKNILSDRFIGRVSDDIFTEREMSIEEFKNKLNEYSIDYTGLEIEAIYGEHLRYLRRREFIRVSEVVSIIEDLRLLSKPIYSLESFSVTTGSNSLPVAVVKLIREGKPYIRSSHGTGPVDALCKAVDLVAGISPRLILYTIETVTEGVDARAEITITVEYRGKRFHGHYGSTDVIEASLIAYLNAVNRILSSGATETEETFYVNGETLWE